MRRRALTLVELLVVVAVVALLCGLLLPGVLAAREAARRSSCTNNLRQIGVALMNYQARLKVFPPGYITRIDPTDRDDLGPGWGWATQLLADIEETSAKGLLDFNRPIDDPDNAAALLTSLPVFSCPSDGRFSAVVDIPKYQENAAPDKLGGANYVGSVGTVRQTCKVCRDRFDGVFGRNSHTRIQNISDGTSKTFAVGERSHDLSSPVWGGVVAKSMVIDNLIPGKVAAGPAYVLGSTFLHGDQSDLELRSQDTVAEIFGSDHGGLMNFLFCDGSVHSVEVTIADDVYMALSTTQDQSPGEGIVHSNPLPSE